MPNKYWFKPKDYGYGAQPSSWEGWVATIGLIALLIWRSLYAEIHPTRFVVELVLLVGAFILLGISKTDGKWKWKWSKKN